MSFHSQGSGCGVGLVFVLLRGQSSVVEPVVQDKAPVQCHEAVDSKVFFLFDPFFIVEARALVH